MTDTTTAGSEPNQPLDLVSTEGLGPVAEARCWEEQRYEKPPRQMFELVQFDGFRALPPGSHALYTRAQLDAAVAAERERIFAHIRGAIGHAEAGYDDVAWRLLASLVGPNAEFSGRTRSAATPG